ncbi:MAG: 3-isopropylmalate dehydratase, partial [Alphaproteobacteria bacterium]
MGRTLFDKIWSAHVVASLGDGIDLLYVDRILLHERTGSIALKSLSEAGRKVVHPEQVFATIDHIVDTVPGRSDETRVPHGGAMIRTTRAQAKAAGIRLFDIADAGQGIVHVIAPEQGITQPGLTIVCPDSHTCTQGAFGALAWGIGSSEAEHALATKTLAVTRPKTMLIRVDGRLAPGVTAKDLILGLIARHSAQGGNGYGVEFAGSAIAAMDMEARMTLCNMAVEFSAFTGLIAPDDKAIAYLEGRPFAPKGALW